MAGSLVRLSKRLAGPLMALLTLAGVAITSGPDQAAVAAAKPKAGIISTIAGGPGGPGPARTIAVTPCGVKFVHGALYIGGDGNVRRVSQRTGRLTTPVSGWQEKHGATFTGPCGVTVDRAGNVLAANDFQVRVAAARAGRFYGQEMKPGHVYAIAGIGVGRDVVTPDGNGGPATQARLNSAVDVELDDAGNVIIADAGTSALRDLPPLGALVWVVAERTGRFYGRKMTAGDIYTVAGTPLLPKKISTLASRAWLGIAIGQVRTDRFGNLVIADINGDNTGPSVRVVAERTGRFYGQKMTAGHIYTIAGNGTTSGNGGLATHAVLACAAGVAVDHAGNVVVADCGQVRVVAVQTARRYGKKMISGHIYAIAGYGAPGYSGDGGPAGRAGIDAIGVTVDSAGNVVLADRSAARVRAVAVRTGSFYGRKVRAGDIYTIAGIGHTLSSGDGGPATRAEFQPFGVAQDRAGNLAIADFAAARVRLVAGASGVIFGRKMTKGDIYTVAKGVSANGVTFDRAGNLVVAAFEGGVDVIAARSGTFYRQHMTVGRTYDIASGFEATAVALDSAGNVLVADDYDYLIKIVAEASGTFYGQPMSAGNVYTIAGGGANHCSDGGPGLAADLIDTVAIAVDQAGNALISGCEFLQVIAATSGTFYGQPMTAGYIYGVAAPRSAGLATALAVDRAGNVVVAESSRVRVLAAVSGRFYGQRMTAGKIYGIAGTSNVGFFGDGGPGYRAAIDQPAGAAIGRAGNVLIADTYNLRIRSVSG